MSKPKPDPAIGARIQERRETLGWTRAELAKRLGMTPAQIQRWEGGTANPLGARREEVARLLGVRESWLATGRGPMLPATEGAAGGLGHGIEI